VPKGNKQEDEFTIIGGGFGDVIVTVGAAFPQDVSDIRLRLRAIAWKRID
jgi:hypothetical protein